jgi:hypothetical protein
MFSLLVYFPCGRISGLRDAMLSVYVCMYTPFQFFNQLNDFHENINSMSLEHSPTPYSFISAISNKHMAGGGCANLRNGTKLEPCNLGSAHNIFKKS